MNPIKDKYYIYQFWIDIGCRQQDLPKAMDDRERERESM